MSMPVSASKIGHAVAAVTAVVGFGYGLFKKQEADFERLVLAEIKKIEQQEAAKRSGEQLQGNLAPPCK